MSLSRSSAIPRSALTTMAASRRSVLRGLALSGLADGGAIALAACGGDDSGGPASGDGATVKFGINEAEGSGAAYDRLKAIADAYAEESGTTVNVTLICRQKRFLGLLQRYGNGFQCLIFRRRREGGEP